MRKRGESGTACFSFVFSSSSSSSCSSTTVHCRSWLLIQSYSIPKGLWKLLVWFLFPLYLNLLQPCSPVCYVVFLISFVPSIVAVTVCWLCILSTWPYNINWGDFVNFTVYVPCIIYFLVFDYSSVMSFFYVSIYFPYTCLFKYYEFVISSGL